MGDGKIYVVCCFVRSSFLDRKRGKWLSSFLWLFSFLMCVNVSWIVGREKKLRNSFWWKFTAFLIFIGSVDRVLNRVLRWYSE